jgi:hypothetical protein
VQWAGIVVRLLDVHPGTWASCGSARGSAEADAPDDPQAAVRRGLCRQARRSDGRSHLRPRRQSRPASWSRGCLDCVAMGWSAHCVASMAQTPPIPPAVCCTLRASMTTAPYAGMSNASSGASRCQAGAR